MTNCEYTFGYGSNMDIEHIRDYLDSRMDEDGKPFGRASLLGATKGFLKDYELVWNYKRSAGTGAANIRSSLGKCLPGVILKVTERGLRGIDKKEGHPDYYSRGKKKLKLISCDRDEIVSVR